MNQYKHIQKFTTAITNRAKLLHKLNFMSKGVGVMFIIYSLIGSGIDIIDLTIGISLIVFSYSTKTISEHFYITWHNVTLKIYKKPETFPPMNKWLVPLDTKEISPDLYDELENLVLDMNNPFITSKVQQVVDFRNGIVTYYDLANLVFITESIVRFDSFEKSRQH